MGDPSGAHWLAPSGCATVPSAAGDPPCATCPPPRELRVGQGLAPRSDVHLRPEERAEAERLHATPAGHALDEISNGTDTGAATRPNEAINAMVSQCVGK